MSAPLCPYCGATSVLVGGDVIYPRRPDLSRKRFWKCLACPDAYVGCHPGTDRPLGRLADARLRQAKKLAHEVFDPLWMTKVERGMVKGKARGLGYQWLSVQLGINSRDCHIGMMDAETCIRVVAICRPHVEKLKQ